MLPEALDVLEDKKPTFEKFVTWVFYGAIVFIGYALLGKFDSVDKNFDAVRVEMAKMNVKLAQIVEHQSYNDKEIEYLREELSRLRDKSRKQFSKGE